MIELDWTLLASAAVFLFTLWGLHTFLFRPLFQVVDRRDGLTTETRREATRKMKHQSALQEKYSERIKAEKLEGYQLAESTRRKAMEERQARLSRAREEAEERLGEARTSYRREMEAARSRLAQDAEEMAEILAARILEKS